MKENVIIKLESKQKQGGHTEKIKEKFNGTCYQKDDMLYFVYQDKEGQKVTVKLKNGELTLNKSGRINWMHIFRPGNTAISRYNMEYGALFLEITTKKVEMQEKDFGYQIELAYSMFAEDDEPVCFELNFTVERGN